jgi:hypothetical protein
LKEEEKQYGGSLDTIYLAANSTTRVNNSQDRHRVLQAVQEEKQQKLAFGETFLQRFRVWTENDLQHVVGVEDDDQKDHSQNRQHLYCKVLLDIFGSVA